MDLIRVEGLAIEAEVGVYPHERGVRRRIVVDIAVEADTREAARTDDIARSTDYDRAAALVREVACSRHHALIEALADDIAQALLRGLGGGVERVFVRVSKPGAVADAHNVSIEIWRDRSAESRVA